MSLERKIAGSLTGYIKGQAIIVILNSIIFLFILNIFKVRFALFLALLTGILSTVPIIGMGTAALIAFLVSVFDGRQLLFIPPFFEGIMLLAVYLILNQIIDLIISPLIIGKTTGISPLALFLSVLIGSLLFGVAGTVLAIPVLIAIKSFLELGNNGHNSY